MTRQVKLVMGGAAVGGLVLASLGLAAGARRDNQLAIGDFAPLFELPGTDGKNHALLDYVRQQKKAIGVVFFCNSCPVAKAYQDRLIKLQQRYADQGLQLILISSNDPKVQPADSFDKMKTLARQKKFPFPYLYDATQVVAKRYGGKVTPHVFLFDKDLKLRYRGRIDNDMDPSKVTKRDLQDAVEAVLAGSQVPAAVTRQFGCSIKWSKTARAAK